MVIPKHQGIELALSYNSFVLIMGSPSRCLNDLASLFILLYVSVFTIPWSQATLNAKNFSLSRTFLYLELFSLSNFSLSRTFLYLELFFISNFSLSRTFLYLEIFSILNKSYSPLRVRGVFSVDINNILLIYFR